MLFKFSRRIQFSPHRLYKHFIETQVINRERIRYLNGETKQSED